MRWLLQGSGYLPLPRRKWMGSFWCPSGAPKRLFFRITFGKSALFKRIYLSIWHRIFRKWRDLLLNTKCLDILGLLVFSFWIFYDIFKYKNIKNLNIFRHKYLNIWLLNMSLDKTSIPCRFNREIFCAFFFRISSVKFIGSLMNSLSNIIGL